jgi:ubiquinone/menaquinone biosynthesis C-methylase UbiE
MERTLEPEVMDGVAEADSYAAMDFSTENEALVARLFALGARGRMLDIGTGPGDIPALICTRRGDARVVGVDLSPAMLAHARRRAEGFGGRFELREADAKGLPFPDASFDAVFSNTILHHIPEPVGFLAEAGRVLRPGGVLLIRDLYRPPTPERALELVALHAGGAAADQKELFRASLHAALEPDELRAAARAAGLRGVEVVVDTDRHMSLQTMTTGPSAG